MSYLNKSYSPLTSEELQTLRGSAERLAAEYATADADDSEAAWEAIYSLSEETDEQENSR